MPSRALIVAAAGRGTRLKTDLPKLLVRVNERPMLDWIAALYRRWVDAIVLVIHPSAADAVSDCVRGDSLFHVAYQASPTGMLDAVLAARDPIAGSNASRVWVTWCDQIGIRLATLRTLAERSDADDAAPLILPTATVRDPYIHLARDSNGRITRALHRREGDAMPDVGESDVGLFSLSRDAYLRDLPLYASAAQTGAGSRERNFLPCIPWFAERGGVETFPASDPREAIGINTPDDLAFVAGLLEGRPE